jgi:hypothetical protein
MQMFENQVEAVKRLERMTQSLDGAGNISFVPWWHKSEMNNGSAD